MKFRQIDDEDLKVGQVLYHIVDEYKVTLYNVDSLLNFLMENDMRDYKIKEIDEGDIRSLGFEFIASHNEKDLELCKYYYKKVSDKYDYIVIKAYYESRIFEIGYSDTVFELEIPIFLGILTDKIQLDETLQRCFSL